MKFITNIEILIYIILIYIVNMDILSLRFKCIEFL